MSLEIRPAKNRQAQADFLGLSQTVYQDDPAYIPAAEALPAEGEPLVAYREGRPVARCCARLQTGNPTIGTIGSFQSIDDPDAVVAMLDAARRWLNAKGAARVIGPMDGDTWHSYRLNLGPYAGAPFIKEPWNPPYYPALWEAAGFAACETYDSYIVDQPAVAAAHQERFYLRCMKNGYTFEPITPRNYAATLPLIHALSCVIFKDNVLYTPVALPEFERMYLPARPMLRPGLSWMAYAPDRQPVGYIFTYPDYADAVRAMNGRSGPLATLRFLMNKRRATRTCIKTLGVTPDRRGSGLTAALTYLSYTQSADLGYRHTLMCLMHSANDSRRFGGQADRPFRSYALYEYKP